jgi:hypothetical protein
MDARRRHVDGRAFDRAIGHFIIQRARQNARRRGLADTADAGEDPGLRNAAGLERIGDGADQRFLADQIVETAGAVFPRASVLVYLRASTR